ncbi:hypothetical protein [Streptosporangium vulgare]
MIYFVIFLLYPALAALYYSFTDWNLRTARRTGWAWPTTPTCCSTT